MLVCLVLLAACAVMEPPPGGPLDTTPPHLVSATPDSGATGVGPIDRLEFRFSEKMTRTEAVGWLFFFPDQRIRKTGWSGAITARVELEDPLPPDTVIVVELAGGMTDAHKVSNRRARRFPIATGAEIPEGNLTGVLVMGDSAVGNAVVELYAVPPDTLEYWEQPLLRRTSTATDGTYVFRWLPVPGGPWLLRAFVDADNNLNPGESEAKRLLPDTLALTADAPAATAGVVTLYAVDTPGRIRLAPFDQFGDLRPLFAWSVASGDVDTGFTLQPVAPERHPYNPVDPAAGSVLRGVKPGINHVGVFLDLDADSVYSVVPDSVLRAGTAGLAWSLADSAADTTGWYLEPLLLARGPRLEPGLDADLAPADSLPVLVQPWSAPPPPPALPDSAALDSLGAALPDSGEAAPLQEDDR